MCYKKWVKVLMLSYSSKHVTKKAQKSLKTRLKMVKKTLFLFAHSRIYLVKKYLVSSIFYKARLESDRLILLVDEAEALLNSLHSSISICACKNKTFGTGVKGTVIKALCQSTNILKFNHDVKRTNFLDIEGYVVANPTPTNTYDLCQFLDESKSRIEARKKLKLI